jgi:hypothetical protein
LAEELTAFWLLVDIQESAIMKMEITLHIGKLNIWRKLPKLLELIQED